MTTEASYRIISIEAENVKRLKAVHIGLQPGSNVIGGRNAQGKSSVLDSVFYALGGKRASCDRPIRDGEDEAKIKVSIGDDEVRYVVIRKIKSTETGITSALSLVSSDGEICDGAQGILDSLVSNLSFDPTNFLRQTPDKKLETLKTLVGLDLSGLDRDRKALEGERLLAGREHKNRKGYLDGLPFHKDAPSEEVSIADLSGELESAIEHNRLIELFSDKVRRMKDSIENQDMLLASTRRTESQIKQQILDLQRQLSNVQSDIEQAEKTLATNKEQTDLAEGNLREMVRRDTSEIQERMGSVGALNAKLMANVEHAKVKQEVSALDAEYAQLTSKIEMVDIRKQKALAEAVFPVPGLSFTEEGVLFNNIPFEQASSAEQLRVSCGMGFALNPRLKTLLIRDGSLLDDNGLLLLAQMAAENDGQIIIERVGNGAECSVIIEDGMVSEVRQPEQPSLL